MHGIRNLEAIRMRGLVPGRGVVILLSQYGPSAYAPMTEEEASGSIVVLDARPDEAFERLDLRCLVGLKVLVMDDVCCRSERAVRALCMAAVTAGAKRVLGYAGVPTGGLCDAEPIFDSSVTEEHAHG